MADGSDGAIPLLRACGAPVDSLRRLIPGPDLIRYWDLSVAGDATGPLADLVVEAGGHPLLFVRSSPATRPQIAHLRRVLALRGDGSQLAVYEPGRLVLYDVALDANPPTATRTIQQSAPDGAFVPSLMDHRQGTDAATSRKVMFDLLRGVTDAIVGHEVMGRPLSPDDALSLAGRALFLRFLADRGIVRGSDARVIAPGVQSVEGLFETPAVGYATGCWLDTTFNGNLLPLPFGGARAWFEALPAVVFKHLGDMLHRAPGGQLSLPLDWGGIDFAHVPPGLLSEVYEAHCAQHYAQAREESIHYTPRGIAELMVSQSLAAMERPWEACVLDPAAGAGVFLVAAYRELVAARWRHDGTRPTRSVLRAILHRQLTGFDINETALRLAALSLYLTALELDPEPTPPDALRFHDLRQGLAPHSPTLVHVGTEALPKGAVEPGSLGPAIGVVHDGQYDLVVGNPPWTSWTKKSPAAVSSGVDRVYQSRGGVGRAPWPDKTPDLAFLWRAMGWARPGGRIALALHGRFLFKQSEPGIAARNAVFAALRVTGIINGAAVRQTGFWPDVSAPFCLLFAQNQTPAEGDACWFVSPVHDPPLNDRGMNRVDMESARPLLLRELRTLPWALKANFRGTSADRRLLDHLMRFPSLKHWWSDTLSLHAEHQGYQCGGEAGKQQDARGFQGLPDLRPRHPEAAKAVFTYDDVELPIFARATLLRPRARTLYRAPLVIVKESIPADRTRSRAAISHRDLFFCESYHGWSCAAAADPELLASWLLLLFNSDIVRYVALLTSSRYGVERDAVLLEDLERTPVPSLDTLAPADRDLVRDLAKRLAHEAKAPWADIDALIARAYGLSPSDEETMRDALVVATPEGTVRAGMTPTPTEQNAWCTRVLEFTNAGLAPFGLCLTRDPAGMVAHGPWLVTRLLLGALDPDATRTSSAREGGETVHVSPQHALASADALSVTEVVARAPDGSITLARIAQYRYWTPTRARLFAARLLQEHGDFWAGLA